MKFSPPTKAILIILAQNPPMAKQRRRKFSQDSPHRGEIGGRIRYDLKLSYKSFLETIPAI